MRNSRRSGLFILSILIMFPIIGHGKSVETLGALQSTLSAHKVIRGSFKQIRTLELFDQPLISEGHFLLSEKYGLQWLQIQPFPVTLVLGSDRLKQTFGDQPTQVIKADENPMMFHFSGLFLSIFRGETERLIEQFDVEFSASTQDTEHWTLKLTPKQNPLNAVFKMIRLQGSEYIDSIHLEEMSGDIFDIRFSNQSSQPVVLTDAERRVFEL